MQAPAADDLIVGALARGDRHLAVELMIHEHGSAIWTHCRWTLGDAAGAEDVYQQTFLEAFRDCLSFRRESSVRTWLVRIAAHRCTDLLRSRRRLTDREEPLDDELADSSVKAATHDLAEAKELVEALLGCLDELSPELRQTLLLRFKADLSFEEMEGALDVSAGALHMRVKRALPVLAGCLDRKGFTP